jgi:hypothetical protein
VKSILEKCTDGQSVRELCEAADSMISAETSVIFKKEKELKKGLFPIPYLNSREI